MRWWKKKIQTKNFLPLVQIFLCWSLINERKTTIFVYWNVAKKSFAPFSVNKPGRKKTTYFFSVFFFLEKKIKIFLSRAQKFWERNLRRIMKSAAIIARPPRLTKCQFRNVFVPCPPPPFSPHSPPTKLLETVTTKICFKNDLWTSEKTKKKPFPENEKIVLKTEFKIYKTLCS